MVYLLESPTYLIKKILFFKEKLGQKQAYCNGLNNSSPINDIISEKQKDCRF
jgi:hypothetical protein